MVDTLSMVISDRYAGAFLTSGKVPVEGFDIDFVRGNERARDEVLHHLNYDIVEMPISNYVIARDLGIALTAIPSFPSLFFPQAGIAINRRARIRGVEDLIGKRVGVNGFGYNPAVWLLGIFFHEFDLPVERITWVEDQDWATAPNSLCSLPFPRSRRFTIERARDLRRLLDEGQIQALILPGTGLEPTTTVERLFPDYLAEIRRYVQSSGIFPINTVITIKEDTVRSNPGLAESLASAHHEAWQLYEREAPADSRHQGLLVSDLRSLGLLPRPEGAEPNRRAVQTLVHYCYEQGLIRRLFEPEDLFIAMD